MKTVTIELHTRPHHTKVLRAVFEMESEHSTTGKLVVLEGEHKELVEELLKQSFWYGDDDGHGTEGHHPTRYPYVRHVLFVAAKMVGAYWVFDGVNYQKDLPPDHNGLTLEDLGL